MELIVSGRPWDEPLSPQAIRNAILATEEEGEGGFLILSLGDADYVQSALNRGAFCLEKREGSEETHFLAHRPASSGGDDVPVPASAKLGFWARLFHEKPAVQVGGRFSPEEIAQFFIAYLEEREEPLDLHWERCFL